MKLNMTLMKKLYLVLITISLIFVFILLDSNELKNITFVIDPGHGGNDPGAISFSGFNESDINYNYAIILKSELKKHGANVYLTRSKDEFVDLEDRVNFSNEKNADYFISLHCNSAENINAIGIEAFYYDDSTSMNLSRILCEIISNDLNRPNRGLKQGNYRVLIGQNCPATLLELGFLSNELEEQELIKRKIINKTAKIITEYFVEITDG